MVSDHDSFWVVIQKENGARFVHYLELSGHDFWLNSGVNVPFDQLSWLIYNQIFVI